MFNNEDYIVREKQKRYAQGVINIFETGNWKGNYSQVSVLRGDTGNLTYGKSQATLSSGNLYLLIKKYINSGGEYSNKMKPYLKQLKNKDVSLNNNSEFHIILEKAGKEDIMRRTQDLFFDKMFWKPTIESALSIKCYIPFSLMVIYDSKIHGSWSRMKKRTDKHYGKSTKIGEVPWIRGYIKTRREWLATHSNHLLRNTVYRMDTFLDMIDNKNWILTPPFTVRDKEVEMEGIEDIINGLKDLDIEKGERELEEKDQHIEDNDDRLYYLTDPYMEDEHIGLIQSMLSKLGYYPEGSVDDVFGPNTEKAVMNFQKDNDLTVDGIIGPETGEELFNEAYSKR